MICGVCGINLITEGHDNLSPYLDVILCHDCAPRYIEERKKKEQEEKELAPYICDDCDDVCYAHSTNARCKGGYLGGAHWKVREEERLAYHIYQTRLEVD